MKADKSYNDGGPAFPRPIGHNGLTHAEEHLCNDEAVGMSLRDYFAAHAAAAFIASPIQVKAAAIAAGTQSQDAVAIMAYEVADAMLAARQR